MYLLFSYYGYYPCGGMKDFVGEYEYLVDCLLELDKHTEDYAQIVRKEDMCVIKTYERKNYKWAEY